MSAILLFLAKYPGKLVDIGCKSKVISANRNFKYRQKEINLNEKNYYSPKICIIESNLQINLIN